MSDAGIDRMIDQYVDAYSHDLAIVLLQILAPPSAGGRGYEIVLNDLWFEIDGWEVDDGRRQIQIDTAGMFSNNSDAERAAQLKDAVEVHFLKSRTGLLPRIAWGTGKVVFGVVETAVGVVGVIVPEPGTTAGGVVMVGLGVNTIGDGISQLAGANDGRGYNVLGEGFAAAGRAGAELVGADPEVGHAVGNGAFIVTSLAAGTWASIRVLRLPGSAAAGLGVGGQPGGAFLGRVDLLYQSGRARDGMTILSINTKIATDAGEKTISILRFVTHGGRLMVNGRIYGQLNPRHLTNSKDVLKLLLKLCKHGWRAK